MVYLVDAMTLWVEDFESIFKQGYRIIEAFTFTIDQMEFEITEFKVKDKLGDNYLDQDSCQDNSKAFA